jgi:hypothetical protein
MLQMKPTGILFSLFLSFASASPALASTHEIILVNDANLRLMKSEILELASPIPAGTRLSLPDDSAPVFNRYRDGDGSVKGSTNGFYPGLRVVSVPPAYEDRFPPEALDRLNSTPGGLYLSSADVNTAAEPGSAIPALPASGSPSSGYSKIFAPNGKRKSNPFAARLKKRFGSQFNREIPLASLPTGEQAKWRAIFGALAADADRTRESPRANLFLDSGSAAQDRALARQYSEDFERAGRIQISGAWTIATQGTAARHGFADRPCAEFVSELVRQAYEKTGYHMSDDFRGDDYLIWNHTAAVTDLATALYHSGWIPWDPAEYRPPAGAIGMNAYADTPGHTYLIAGAGGRFIVDNGSPKGRDLYNTSAKNIENMYNLGAFFLPPGIVPARW